MNSKTSQLLYTWSQSSCMFNISSSAISVPIDVSAAALTFSSISSGKISDKSVELTLSLVPKTKISTEK